MRNTLVKKIAFFQAEGRKLVASKETRKQYQGNAYLLQAEKFQEILAASDNTTLYRRLNALLGDLKATVFAYERTREMNIHPGVNDAYKAILQSFR